MAANALGPNAPARAAHAVVLYIVKVTAARVHREMRNAESGALDTGRMTALTCGHRRFAGDRRFPRERSMNARIYEYLRRHRIAAVIAMLALTAVDAHAVAPKVDLIRVPGRRRASAS